MEHTRKKLKSSSSATYDVAGNSDLTNQISQYLSPEDLVSIHSTSKSQSEAANKIMKYVEAAKGRQIKKKGKSFIQIPDNFVIKFPYV